MENKDFFDVKNEVLSFREYFTETEAFIFLCEEKQLETLIEKMIREFYKKHNEIVSNRISQSILIEEVKKSLSCSSIELTSLLKTMDNDSLQQVLSVVHKSKTVESLKNRE